MSSCLKGDNSQSYQGGLGRLRNCLLLVGKFKEVTCYWALDLILVYDTNLRWTKRINIVVKVMLSYPSL